MSKGDNYPNTVEADTIILKRHLPFSVESLLKATSSSNTLNKYNSVVSQPTLPFSQNEEIYHEKKEVKLRITTPTSIDSVNGDNKKKRRQRLTFTSSQVRILEFEFSLHRYITTENRLRLSKMLGITQQQIKIWYQNRRYKTKPGIGKKENTQNINGSFNDWIYSKVKLSSNYAD
uniref:Homeobox domain-containing protein n=1 Tax=Rhabditophanes sp. KR3021 TaxID=114890 RepID=A0AC35U6I5_9BILA